MPLFHATDKAFTSGKTVQVQGASQYYSAAATVLDNGRPAKFPLRKDLMFAAEFLVAATAFCERQGVPHKFVRVYKVDMQSSHRAPFALIHQINKRLTEKKAVKSWSMNTGVPNESGCSGKSLDLRSSF